jgi:aspartyl/asparaginyl beta-hydroxylase (cupin superfamily)
MDRLRLRSWSASGKLAYHGKFGRMHCMTDPVEKVSIGKAPAAPSADPPLAAMEPAFWHHELHRVPWCVALEGQADAIREEILGFIAKFRPFMPYPKYKIPHFDSLYDNTWDAFPLSIFQGEHIELSKAQLSMNIEPLVRTFRSRLPLVSGLISDLEQQGVLRNVFVSRLIPGSIIHPHRGWTSEFLRIHLCLQDDPGCSITVGDETRTWKQGKLLAFKDGGPYPHSVVHQGTSERIIISHDLSLGYLSRFIPALVSGAGGQRS